jgi:hypothetical protein
MFAASQIPFAYAQMGWHAGSAFFALIILTSWVSGYLLTASCVQCGAYTWPDLGRAAFGDAGAIGIEALQIVGIVLTGMVQTQGAGSVWQQAFPDAPLCSWQWILVNSVPYLLFLQIPSFGGTSILRVATWITIAITFWRVGLFLTLMMVYGTYDYNCYGGQTWSTIFSGISNMMFTFGVKNVLPEMTRELRDPIEMHKSWTAANVVAMPVYVLFGVWGFYAFGVFNQGASFILNFKNTAATASYNIVSACLGYLPLVYGQICIFLKVELRYGVLPTDWWHATNEENAFPRVPPVLFRFLFRSAVVSAYVFFAEALIGVGLGNFASLAGAVSISCFSFYMPFIIYMRVFPVQRGKQAFYGLCAAFAITMAFLAVVASAQQMATMANAGLFSAPCHQNAYFMGEYGGGNGGYSPDRGPGSFYDTFYTATSSG